MYTIEIFCSTQAYCHLYVQCTHCPNNMIFSIKIHLHTCTKKTTLTHIGFWSTELVQQLIVVTAFKDVSVASKAVFDTLYSASVVKEVSGSYEVSTHVLEEGEGEGEGEEGSREREGREGRGKGRGRRAVGREGREGREGSLRGEEGGEGRGGECLYIYCVARQAASVSMAHQIS